MERTICRDADGSLPAYAWPGGYPIFYLLADGACLCPNCANGRNGSEAKIDHEDKQWRIVAQDCNWEDPSMFCEHCNRRIQSAYAEDEAD